MGYIPLAKLLKNSGGSMYKLVTLASRRAKELGMGSAKLIEATKNTKITSIALEEIKEDRIVLKVKKK